MNDIVGRIIELAEASEEKPDFVDFVFGVNRKDVSHGRAVVLFGAGSGGVEMLFALQRKGVRPVAFCDNDVLKVGTNISGLPVISLEDLTRYYHDSIIVITTPKYRSQLRKQLLSAGFLPDQICCDDDKADYAHMYAMIGTQSILLNWEKRAGSNGLQRFLIDQEEKVEEAYHILSDEKSRELYITWLAVIVSEGNFQLFCHLIRNFSDAYKIFGLTGYEGPTEDYFYFNNDVLTVSDGEVLVDAGAYDGDTIGTFMDACRCHGVTPEHIYALEPDPDCLARLRTRYVDVDKISCHQLGLWSTTHTMRFLSSGEALRDHAGHISDAGDIEINVVDLDTFLEGRRVSFIKMDVEGAEAEALKGARLSIQRWRPKLALSAYHRTNDIFDLPILVRDLCTGYRLSLRQFTNHLSDIVLLATP